MSLIHRRRLPIFLTGSFVALLGWLAVMILPGAGQVPQNDLAEGYARQVQPLLKKYCLGCHSTKAKKGSLDLERFASLQQMHRDLKPWQLVIEQLEAGEMPPKEKPQPTADERKKLIVWIASFLDAEARARTGDPGRVPLRRLSNAEYDSTIRDLTGVDLRPTREFPADGAAGEGFTNAAESLSDITPVLFTRYLNAAKDIADHAVLLPDGFRFAPGKTRRDWTDESLARLRTFYREYTSDGRLPLQPYLLATVRHREALTSGKITLAEVAAREKVNPKYLGVLWQTLTDKAPSHPLDQVRARWRQAGEKEMGPLAAEITVLQQALWKFVPVGSYRYGNTVRQVANSPTGVESPLLRLALKPVPGQSEVVLYLVTRDLAPQGKRGRVVWHRPRFEGAGKAPLLLRDYAQFGPAYEVDYSLIFADTSRYLAAAAQMAHDRAMSTEECAKKHSLDAAFLKRWIEVLAIKPPTQAVTPGKPGLIPPVSVLGRWREAAMDPTRSAEAVQIAQQVQTLLTGARPANEKSPDRLLYDSLVLADSALLKGLELARFVKPRPRDTRYGIDTERFGRHPDGKTAEEASLVAGADTVTEVRLPAALFRDRVFAVEGQLDAPPGERVVQFQVLSAPPGPGTHWDGKSPVATSPGSAAFKGLLQGHADFRRCFPWYLCFPNVVPTDEVVSLKMFHREDEPLERLFLDEEQKQRIDHLWNEHRFISQQALAENNYLPPFIGFVSQDQPKELLQYFEGQRPVFKKRAEDFEKDSLAAIPRQLEALPDFASRAFRRPLQEKEKTELLALYQTIRKKGAAHEEALRGVLARILVAPAFLFRIEKAPAGTQAGPVNDWELATRLSYFLWSSLPDDELRQLAAGGKLRDPKVLTAQTQRMLKDKRLRGLAIEFGTQWIHVRGFDELKEKNEKLFPTFDADLRKAIYEETILFFQDLFQSDRAVTQILDADDTFLNETLAKHYGIPGVAGQEWRRVAGVRKFGRGGILGLASVQAKQSGASRTSPVLRGNWVVETLLGEKLPRPPANVPILPDEEGGADKRTTRQQVEKHVADASCAACHVRIDPFGFAFEKYDAIGRFRLKDLGGLPVDATARLKDGTEFEGIDGLRAYLLTKKKDVIIRLFCRKLLGYALGRVTALSDTHLIDQMVLEMNKNDERLSAAVLTIVRSPQFQSIRGRDVAIDD